MGLTERKIINNELPKFNTGTEGLITGRVRLETPQPIPFADQSIPPIDISKVLIKMPNTSAPKTSSPKINWGKLGGYAESGMNVLGAGLGFIGALKNAGTANVSADEMIRGGNSGQIDGISYDTKTVDSANAMAAVDAQATQGVFSTAASGMSLGGSIGSIAGPVGGAIGAGVGAIGGAIAGIFSGNKAKREAERQRLEALARVNAYNERNFNNAFSQSLRNKEYSKYGNLEQQLLYLAKLGHEPKFILPRANFKTMTFTSSGEKYTRPNANTNLGERLVEMDPHVPDLLKKVQYVDKGPNDTAPTYLGEYTAVASNDKDMINPETGNTISEDVPDYKRRGELNHLFAIQKFIRENNGMRINQFTARYGREKLPKFWKGYENFLNTAVNGLGFGISAFDLANHRSLDVFNPNIQTSNKYEGAVSDIMASRMPNEYPIMRDMQELESAERYGINNSPALSSGQRVLTNITNSMNTRLGRANALLNIQNIRNQFAKERADMLNNMGQFDAQMRQKNDAFNAQSLAAAAAKKADLIQNDKYNMLNYATQYAKNAWEARQFNDMMDLYRLKINGDKPWYANGTNVTFHVPQEVRDEIGGAYNPSDAFNSRVSDLIKSGDLNGSMLSPSIDVDSKPTITNEMFESDRNNITDAIKMYLRSKGLKPDGIIGPKTWRTIKPQNKSRNKRTKIYSRAIV